MNKSEYVNTMTNAYEANIEAEIKLHTAANRDFQSLFDSDMINQLDMQEYVSMLKVFGHHSESSDKAAFMNAFNNTESGPLDVEMEKWIRFMKDNSTSALNDTMDEAIKKALHKELYIGV